MAEIGRIRRDDALLLVIDVQEKFEPVIPNIADVVRNTAILVRGCRELHVPILVTEQYPKGLGHTIPAVAEALGDFTPMEKMAFSLFREESIHSEINDVGRRDLIILGVEAHVCVIQTVLDARLHGFKVHLVSDAVSSRNPFNTDIAIQRAIQAGAFISSTEMLLFQMLETAADPSFRTISKIVK